MKTIYSVRHGRTALNDESTIIGHSDVPILNSARKEIGAIAQRLLPEHFDIILTSDLRRAVQTAEIIQSYLKAPLIASSDLREVDYGDLVQQPKKEVRVAYPSYHKDQFFVHPSGESFQQMYDRIVVYLDSVLREYNSLLLVTHAGCIRALYAYCNNLDFNDVLTLPLTNNVILKCVIHPDGKKEAYFLQH